MRISLRISEVIKVITGVFLTDPWLSTRASFLGWCWGLRSILGYLGIAGLNIIQVTCFNSRFQQRSQYFTSWALFLLVKHGEDKLATCTPGKFSTWTRTKRYGGSWSFVFGCVFSGCFYSYRHYMPLYTIFRGLYLNDSVHLVSRHVCRKRSEWCFPRNHDLNSFGIW